MKNIMILDNHKAVLEYDAELDLFRGEILGLNGGADFYGKTPDELRAEFRKSLDVFFEVCQEKGISPYKKYSGEFNVRVPPELHHEIEERAVVEGKSLNEWVVDRLE